MSGMPVSQESAHLMTGGQSQVVAIGAASVASTALTSKTVILTATADCFIRQGAAPVALATGVDQFLPANAPMRYAGLVSGNKIAVIAAGATTGNLYITPEY